MTRLVGGLGFCLGLVLVGVAGAELFTGNNLLAMAWVSRLIGTRDILRNWMLVYLGNVVGCLGTVQLVLLADIGGMGVGAVGETAVQIARSKAALTLLEGFWRGLLCNALVCLAVWLPMGGRSVTDKILAILFPITAFVAIGFEHSIANWFFLPYGLLLGGPDQVPVAGIALNLVTVTAGNIVGGTLLGLVVMAGLVGFAWTPYDPYELDFSARLVAPSAAHWFGTDGGHAQARAGPPKGARTRRARALRPALASEGLTEVEVHAPLPVASEGHVEGHG